MDKLDKILPVIANEIAIFLKANGGRKNGYETTVDGCVVKNTFSSLEIYTPAFNNLTLNEINSKGRELYNIILNIIVENNINEKIFIYSVHEEHGCYRIYVKYEIRQRVNL